MDLYTINEQFGNSDLFLIDQILKRRFTEGSRILDAGCGEGRNLTYFFRHDFDTFGIDKNLSALRLLMYSAPKLSKNFKPEHFIHGDILTNPFEEKFFDTILCLSVLHFSESRVHFLELVGRLVRVLKVYGMLMISMNSGYHPEGNLLPAGQGKYRLPGGEIRYLLDGHIINELSDNFPLKLIDPVRTLTIHGQESLTYLTLLKTGEEPEPQKP